MNDMASSAAPTAGGANQLKRNSLGVPRNGGIETGRSHACDLSAR
jgi:hypothetical protein